MPAKKTTAAKKLSPPRKRTPVPKAVLVDGVAVAAPVEELSIGVQPEKRARATKAEVALQTDEPSRVQTQVAAPSRQQSPQRQEPEEPDMSEQVKAAVRATIKKLRISVEEGDFTNPNDRTVKLMLGKECLSSASFSVRSRREYEG